MAKLIEAIEKRRAYRALSVEAPSDEVVDRIMMAAVYAPSCSNKQPWRFLVARNEAAREKVAEALADGNYWAKGAPLFVLAITKPELDCRLKDRRDYALFDTGMAAMNLQLQAVNEGLRAHPMAGFDDTALKKSFEIPEEYILVTVIALGYPGSTDTLNEKHVSLEESERSRKESTEVICYDEWTL